MLSKLFRSRQPTTSLVPPFESQPTPDQPTSPKPSSKLVHKFKELKKALRPSRWNRKADDEAGQKSRGSHKSNGSDESWGNLAPGPFTAEDYEYRRGSPISTHQDVGPSLPSIEGPSGTGTPSSRSSSPQSVFATNPRQLVPTLTTPLNASVFSQQPLTTSQVEAEDLPVRKAGRADAQEVQAIHSMHVHNPVPRTTSITQRATPEVPAGQPIKEHLAPESKARTKTNKQQIEGRNKWWEMGGNTKRHFRREAVDYGYPYSDYCDIEVFGEKARALKRGGANQRREPPRKQHSSKQAHGSKKESENQSIQGQQTVDRAPSSTATDAFKGHGRTLSSTSTGAAQAPPFAARQPLASFDLNIVLDVEASPPLQAAGVEDSKDGDGSSQETEVQGPSPDASLGLDGIIFHRRKNTGPSQH